MLNRGTSLPERKSAGFRDLAVSPRFMLAVLLLGAVAAAFLLQIFKQQNIYFGNKLMIGNDFTSFYGAAVSVRHGYNPYSVNSYVTPPIPAFLVVPFTFLNLILAIKIELLVTLASVGGALYLIHRAFNPHQGPDRYSALLEMAVIICFSYPVFSLVERGNIDGLVLLLLSVFLFSLEKSERIAGIVLAVAISLKIYPIIVFLPLAAFRRWKTLVYAGSTLVVLFLLMPHLWVDFLSNRVLQRLSYFYPGGWNISLASTLYGAGYFLDTSIVRDSAHQVAHFLGRTSLYIYVLLLILMFAADFLKKKESRERICASILMYFPFMLSVPGLSHQYELVSVLAMIPAIDWYWTRSREIAVQMILLFITLGIAASQFEAAAIWKLTGAGFLKYVPGLGLFCIMLGAVLFKSLEALRSPGEGVREPA